MKRPHGRGRDLSGSDIPAGGGGGEPVSGSVVVSGSSTVEPISIIVGEKFKEANPDAGVTVDGPGTGDGFQLLQRRDRHLGRLPPDQRGRGRGLRGRRHRVHGAGHRHRRPHRGHQPQQRGRRVPRRAGALRAARESEGIDNWSGKRRPSCRIRLHQPPRRRPGDLRARRGVRHLRQLRRVRHRRPGRRARAGRVRPGPTTTPAPTTT